MPELTELTVLSKILGGVNKGYPKRFDAYTDWSVILNSSYFEVYYCVKRYLIVKMIEIRIMILQVFKCVLMSN